MYASGIGANNMRTSSADAWRLPNYEAVPPPAVRPFAEYLRAAGYYTTNNAKTDYQFTPPLTAWDENGRDAHWKNRPEGMPFFSVFNLETTHESQVWDRANDPVVVPPERVLLPALLPRHARDPARRGPGLQQRRGHGPAGRRAAGGARGGGPRRRHDRRSSTPTTAARSRAASASCSTRACTCRS